MAALINLPRRDLLEYLSDTSESAEVRAGSPLPLGTQESGGGVNFAIFSRNASRVRLEFFNLAEDAAPIRLIEFDSARNRTGDVWHVWVKGIAPGQLYAYRVDGPYQPSQGHRFNFRRLLLDPCATAISQPPQWDFPSARGYDPSSPQHDLTISNLDNSGLMPKCVFANEPFDWADDKPLRHPWSETIIYEAHLRGLPPPPPEAQWRLAVDTFVETPFDLSAPGGEPLLKYPQTYLLKPRSSAILLARKPEYAKKGSSK